MAWFVIWVTMSIITLSIHAEEFEKLGYGLRFVISYILLLVFGPMFLIVGFIAEILGVLGMESYRGEEEEEDDDGDGDNFYM